MFFGGAAYVSGQILKTTALPLELALLGGVAAAALLGLAIGWLSIRRQGIQFAMITLAFSQFVYFALLQATFTGGENGMQGIPRSPLFGLFDVRNNFLFYYVVLLISAATIFGFYRIVHSPFGEVLKAIRDNEARVESLGFDPEKFKLVAFTLSAAMAGLAGALKATVFQFATLTDVSWQVSGEVILMTLLGGLGTLTGPMFGAAIVVFMNDYLAGFGEWALIAQGCILLVVIVFFRRGFRRRTDRACRVAGQARGPAPRNIAHDRICGRVNALAGRFKTRCRSARRTDGSDASTAPRAAERPGSDRDSGECARWRRPGRVRPAGSGSLLATTRRSFHLPETGHSRQSSSPCREFGARVLSYRAL